MGRLSGKVAIVTGASRGIGRGIANALADGGADVVLAYVSGKDAAEAVAANIRAAGGGAIAVKADVAQQADASALIAAALDTFGRLDILVNNGGIYEYAAIEDSTEAMYRRLFDVNVLGTMLTTQAALPHLDQGTSIINVSSAATKMTPPRSALYSATKGAIDTLTRVLARELGPRGIRVNAVNPGLVETDGTRAGRFLEGANREWAEGASALGRIGQVEDIAPVVAFLASDEARWLTGEIVYATGGM